MLARGLLAGMGAAMDRSRLIYEAGEDDHQEPELEIEGRE